MALGDVYVTAAELKIRLGLEDVEDDVRITGAVESATDGINDVTKRDFQKNTTATARAFYPDTPLVTYVNDFHTTTGLVVKIDEDDDGVFETTVASSQYQLEPLDGVVDGREGWPFWKIRMVDDEVFPRFRRATVQVTAQWGWASVPVSIKEAAYVLAEDIFKIRDTPFGVGGFADFGRIRARENPHVAMLINQYRRRALKVA